MFLKIALTAKMLPTTENIRLEGLPMSEHYGPVELIKVVNIVEIIIYNITKQYINPLLNGILQPTRSNLNG